MGEPHVKKRRGWPAEDQVKTTKRQGFTGCSGAGDCSGQGRRHDLTTGPGSHTAEQLSLRTTSSELTRPRACALQQEQPAQRS